MVMKDQEMYGLSELHKFVSISPWQGVDPEVRTEQVTRMYERQRLVAFEGGGKLIRRSHSLQGQPVKASKPSSCVREGMQRLQRMYSKPADSVESEVEIDTFTYSW